MYQNIGSTFFRFVTKHACDRRTDKQKDGQNYGSQDRASIAAARGEHSYLLLNHETHECACQLCIIFSRHNVLQQEFLYLSSAFSRVSRWVIKRFLARRYNSITDQHVHVGFCSARPKFIGTRLMAFCCHRSDANNAAASRGNRRALPRMLYNGDQNVVILLIPLLRLTVRTC